MAVVDPCELVRQVTGELEELSAERFFGQAGGFVEPRDNPRRLPREQLRMFRNQVLRRIDVDVG